MGASKFKRLDKKVIAARKVEGIISLFVYTVIIVTLLYCTFTFHWPEWIVIITTCLAIISLPFELYWAPMWRYRIWRYKINETSIQIQKGILFKRKILIPMGKVQHIDAKQGPILKRYHLYTLMLSTAAGSHHIPGLAEETADSIRKEIEIYARLYDEQV
ncbi:MULTISPECIES: PH domain-containing protein [Bacillus]|uniref:PH domain-containing protein n=1 Tax=Bacillus pretiosus TaxID=2983392 RepID=A0ABT3ET10_9BACI|nr:PH domain-containing protein [Bacillus pretiosus]